ncbi:ATP-dependent DNA helicase PIF1 [Elysia marginata]|uniref:ATP-dependent DNA helicase PIF1 n=1 Tax=Elysia marginata TaxID=1093978 RepID=A0AAV4EHA8_9GAST|nr:ATP-dependent DNA helicase PIF1 [Elysia marginata]
MLLLTLDPAKGHCNGTRYIRPIHQMHGHINDARVVCGPLAGKRIVIPRIPLKPSDNVFPFQMIRKQFLIRPSFAIIANKSQGQTLKKIGISFNTDFFPHGQLYVALRRVGSRQSVKIYPSIYPAPGVTSNVVYKEILQL